jgi:hypothetical protein
MTKVKVKQSVAKAMTSGTKTTLKKKESIEPMDSGVRVRKGAPQYYKGKEEPEAKKKPISGSSAFKKVDLKK